MQDTLNRPFYLLDAKAFETAPQARVSGARRKSAVHMVSAFATELGLALAQQSVADKGNVLSAIPDLLATLELRGCLISLDALGCMRQITSQIRACGADYLLAVESNQPLPQQAVQDAFVDIPDAQAHGQELRYCISSAALLPDNLATAVRRHRPIENGLQGRPDVTFREDACAVRQNNASGNLSIIRRRLLSAAPQARLLELHAGRVGRIVYA